MTLKDVVELVMAPGHNDEKLENTWKAGSVNPFIGIDVFPEENLKHHFYEHYPWLTTAFGLPLPCHLKPNIDSLLRILRQTGSFRNIFKTMARKHQSMTSYQIHYANNLRPKLSVSRMPKVAVAVAVSKASSC